jgi:hypothetical protein
VEGLFDLKWRRQKSWSKRALWAMNSLRSTLPPMRFTAHVLTDRERSHYERASLLGMRYFCIYRHHFLVVKKIANELLHDEPL